MRDMDDVPSIQLWSMTWNAGWGGMLAGNGFARGVTFLVVCGVLMLAGPVCLLTIRRAMAMQLMRKVGE